MNRHMVAVIIVLSALSHGGAQAHDALAGWSYPYECCCGRDCAEYPARWVEERADGFLLRSTGWFVPRAEARRSRDEFFHLCRPPTGGRGCFFVPDRGM